MSWVVFESVMLVVAEVLFGPSVPPVVNMTGGATGDSVMLLL
ncbi:MAG: hypothetical protein ACP5IZ_09170 [Thermoprotei archaeon]